jgi:hypothetical protein
MNKIVPQAGPEQKRRTERVLLRMPIEVSGKDLNGHHFKEKTSTVVINRDGAQISLKHPVRDNEKLIITNLQNQKSCPFRVVRKAQTSLGEGPEWGVECLEPEKDFWGIAFPTKIPPKIKAPADEELIDALLECADCRSRELAQLTMEQYRGLSSRASVSRPCATCNATTGWSFGFVESDTEEIPGGQAGGAAQDGAKPSEAERRRARRMTVKLPLYIRAQDGGEEFTKTENLSKTGICFISKQTMNTGDIIMLTVGYAPGRDLAEIPARVVWRRPLEGETQALYGVHLEKAR